MVLRHDSGVDLQSPPRRLRKPLARSTSPIEKSQPVGGEVSTDDQRLEALLALFADLSTRERALSERQYTVAVIVVTLNLAITAGLMTFPHALACPAKLLGVLAILTFNGFAIWYINQKADAYWTASDERARLKFQVMAIANPAGHESDPTVSPAASAARASFGSTDAGASSLTRGWKGSLAFVVVVFITAIVAILVLLLQGQLTV